MVAEASAITDPGHAAGADGVEISFVQGEIRVAEVAGITVAFTGSAAGRASNHRGIVGLGPLNPQDGATETAKPRPCRQLAGIVLPIALGTGHQNSHEKKNGAIGHRSQLGLAQGSLQPSWASARLTSSREQGRRLGRVA